MQWNAAFYLLKKFQWVIFKFKLNIETFVFQFSIVSWKQSWFKGLAEIILNLVDQNQTSFSLGLWAGFCTQTLPFGEEENKTFHHLEQQQQ